MPSYDDLVKLGAKPPPDEEPKENAPETFDSLMAKGATPPVPKGWVKAGKYGYVKDPSALGAAAGHYVQGTTKGSLPGIMGKLEGIPDRFRMLKDSLFGDSKLTHQDVSDREAKAERETRMDLAAGVEAYPKTSGFFDAAGDLASDYAMKKAGVPANTPGYQALTGAVRAYNDSEDKSLEGAAPSMLMSAAASATGAKLGNKFGGKGAVGSMAGGTAFNELLMSLTGATDAEKTKARTGLATSIGFGTLPRATSAVSNYLSDSAAKSSSYAKQEALQGPSENLRLKEKALDTARAGVSKADQDLDAVGLESKLQTLQRADADLKFRDQQTSDLNKKWRSDMSEEAKGLFNREKLIQQHQEQVARAQKDVDYLEQQIAKAGDRESKSRYSAEKKKYQEAIKTRNRELRALLAIAGKELSATGKIDKSLDKQRASAKALLAEAQDDRGRAPKQAQATEAASTKELINRVLQTELVNSVRRQKGLPEIPLPESASSVLSKYVDGNDDYFAKKHIEGYDPKSIAAEKLSKLNAKANIKENKANDILKSLDVPREEVLQAAKYRANPASLVAQEKAVELARRKGFKVPDDWDFMSYMLSKKDLAHPDVQEVIEPTMAARNPLEQNTKALREARAVLEGLKQPFDVDAELAKQNPLNALPPERAIELAEKYGLNVDSDPSGSFLKNRTAFRDPKYSLPAKPEVLQPRQLSELEQMQEFIESTKNMRRLDEARQNTFKARDAVDEAQLGVAKARLPVEDLKGPNLQGKTALKSAMVKGGLGAGAAGSLGAAGGLLGVPGSAVLGGLAALGASTAPVLREAYVNPAAKAYLMGKVSNVLRTNPGLLTQLGDFASSSVGEQSVAKLQYALQNVPGFAEALEKELSTAE